jgi:predicted dehydrogenase
MPHLVTRRSFVRTAGLALTAEAFLHTRAHARAWENTAARAPRPDPVRLGHIGVGGQGLVLLRGFLQLEESRSVAVCDPYGPRREAAAAEADAHYSDPGGCAAYNDFRVLLERRDLDAVVIATPDHWHVPLAAAAVAAGKDVYVEKPLGLSLRQGQALRAAVARHGRIFQYGTQQRSFSTHCAFACELVRNGYLGELEAVHVAAPNGETGGDPTPCPVPEGLDYDLWLGPAPGVPFSRDRVFGTGRWHIYDHALGFIAGWGAHPLDVAHWGYPHVPVRYEGTGFVPTEGLFDTVVNWEVRGRYASGVAFTFTHGEDRTDFTGSEGRVSASRAGISADPPSLLSVRLRPDETRLLQDNNHYRNFARAVRRRFTPASDVASAVQSDAMSHLSDMAVRLGRPVHWDPVAETVTGDAGAERLMDRPVRPPWRV